MGGRGGNYDVVGSQSGLGIPHCRKRYCLTQTEIRKGESIEGSEADIG